MTVFAYFFFWLLAHVLALGLGIATHYSHAFLSLPDKLVDGFGWRDHALNGALNNRYVWWADYDEQGFWEFYSLKNFLIHAVPANLLVFAFGLAWLPQRAEVVAAICRTVANAGLKPVPCM